jgi:3-hydroxyisobutyrate dehydrogenase-like beta-hydroxyacid dehydrogenase
VRHDRRPRLGRRSGEPISIGFVGLGNMGAVMSARLVAARFTVHGFDIAPTARAALVDDGGQAHDDLRHAVRDTSVVILILPGRSRAGWPALNNLLSATHLLSEAEVMAAGQRFGLDPEVMLAVFNSSSGQRSTRNKCPNFVLPSTFDSGFALRLVVKDMRIALRLAEQVGAAEQLSRDSFEIWSAAADALPPTADHTELARWVLRMSAPATTTPETERRNCAQVRPGSATTWHHDRSWGAGPTLQGG